MRSSLGIALLIVIVSFVFFTFLINPLIGLIGNINPHLPAHAWCEIPGGVIGIDGMCPAEIGAGHILLSLVAFSALVIASSIIIFSDKKKGTRVIVLLLWMLIMLSLPVVRSALGSLMLSMQIIFIAVVLISLHLSRRPIVGMIISAASIIASGIIFGYLFMLLLLPLIVIFFLRRGIWKEEKNWYRMLLFSYPVIALLMLSSYILFINAGSSLPHDFVSNVLLSSMTHGYPLSFIAALLFAMAVIFIRIEHDPRLVLISAVGLLYFALFGPVSLAFHLVIFSMIFLYAVDWIVKSRWTLPITRHVLMATIIGSIVIFSLISLPEATGGNGFGVAELEGAVFSLGPHTALYACAYDVFPGIGYERRAKMREAHDIIALNDPGIIHEYLRNANVSNIVIDRAHVISILGRDDTGLLFALRVSDDFVRIYPDGANDDMEYYYVYP
jgi:hypothetical protein